MSSAVPMVLMGGGMALNAYGQIQQGNAAKKTADANAQIAIQNAATQSQADKEKAYGLSEQKRQMIGKQATILGGSGVDVGTGSSLDVMSRTAAEYQRDIEFAGIAADDATLAGQNQASIDQYMGRQKQMAGWLGAGSTLLTGTGKMWSQTPPSFS